MKNSSKAGKKAFKNIVFEIQGLSFKKRIIFSFLWMIFAFKKRSEGEFQRDIFLFPVFLFRKRVSGYSPFLFDIFIGSPLCVS